MDERPRRLQNQPAPSHSGTTHLVKRSAYSQLYRQAAVTVGERGCCAGSPQDRSREGPRRSIGPDIGVERFPRLSHARFNSQINAGRSGGARFVSFEFADDPGVGWHLAWRRRLRRLAWRGWMGRGLGRRGLGRLARRLGVWRRGLSRLWLWRLGLLRLGLGLRRLGLSVGPGLWRLGLS